MFSMGDRSKTSVLRVAAAKTAVTTIDMTLGADPILTADKVGLAPVRDAPNGTIAGGCAHFTIKGCCP